MQDDDCYKYVEDWTALNYNDEAKAACDAAGTSPFLHQVLGTVGIPAAYSISDKNDQRFSCTDKGNIGYIPNNFRNAQDALLEDQITIRKRGLLVAQAASDESIGRKLFAGNENE